LARIGFKGYRAFYTEAGRDVPTWINALYLSNVVEETNELTYFELRSFFGQAIIDGYRKDPIIVRDSYDDTISNDNVSMEEKLNRSLKQGLIQYLHLRTDGSIVITHDIVRELQNKRISNKRDRSCQT